MTIRDTLYGRDLYIEGDIVRVGKRGNGLAVRAPNELVNSIDRRAQFLDEMAQFNWPLPEGYKFDHEETNKRR